MYLLLVNTKAGNNRYQYIERSLKAILDKAQVKYKIVLISDLAEIDRLLEENIKSNTKAIIAVGGNGTVTHVIDAMIDYDLPLGIIPTSKSNQLANSLGVKNWKAGVKLLIKPNIVSKKLGKIGQRYFVGPISIAPKKNIITDILNKQHWLRQFLGSNLNKNIQDSHNVACKINLDSNLEVQCQANNIELNMIEGVKKSLKIAIHALDKHKDSLSIFRANQISISSSLNLPILSGNEILASTPATIKSTNKSIEIIQP